MLRFLGMLALMVSRKLGDLAKRIKGPLDKDVSLDHFDAAESKGRFSLPSGLDREVMAALLLKCQCRSELAAKLGDLLDEVDYGEQRNMIEFRLASTCARVARDACLVVAGRRTMRARESGAGLGLTSDLRSFLYHVGRLQSLLGKSTSPRELWEATGDALGCRDQVLDALARDDVLDPQPPRRRAPSEQRRSRKQLCDVVLKPAGELRRRKRAIDEDAKLLRRRGRRKFAARLFLTSAAGAGVWKLKSVIDASGGARALCRDVARMCKDIAQRRLVDPAVVIKDDLLLNKNDKHRISDPKALKDAELTLESMLNDWLNDVKPGRSMSKVERAERARDYDMSTVNAVLAEEVQHAVRNLVRGNIARALLIQIQFVSKEMYRAMGSIDDILAQNEATIQVLALFPAAFLVYGAFRLLNNFVIAISSESVQSTEKVKGDLSALLAEAMRQALLAKEPTLPLPDEQFGALALQIHTLRDRLAKERARFNLNRLRRLDRSLRDIFTPGLSANQIKDIITQIIWENDFLRLDDATIVPRPIPVLDENGLLRQIAGQASPSRA